MRIRGTLAIAGVIVWLLHPRVMADEGGHPNAHQPGEHAHGSPHGGQAVTAGQYHFELVAQPDGLRVYLSDEHMKPLPIKDVTGNVQVVAGAQTQKAELVAGQDTLEARLDLSKLEKFVAVVTLVIAGQTQSARFAVDRAAHQHQKGAPAEHPHDKEAPAHHHEDRSLSSPEGKTAASGSPGPRRSGRQVVTGEIVDSYCYLTRGAEGMGPAHRDCAARCLEKGHAPLLRDEASGTIYLLARPDGERFADEILRANVAERVRVTGEVVEGEGLRLLAAEDISREHDHDAAPHGGVVGMIGERHIEVVSLPEGEIRIFLLDAFMRPVSVAGVSGTATIRSKNGGQRAAVVASQSGGEFLLVKDTSLRPDDDDITVDLAVADDALRMTLPFRDRDADDVDTTVSRRDGHHHH